MLWSDSLLTGVRKIDEQHRELVSRVDQVLEAGMKGRGADEIDKLLIFLREYVVEHFNDEQELQRESNYPDYAAHKSLHDGFVRRVQDLIDRYEKAGPTLDVVMSTNKVVVDWLIEHINAEDKAFAKYYKQTMGIDL